MVKCLNIRTDVFAATLFMNILRWYIFISIEVSACAPFLLCLIALLCFSRSYSSVKIFDAVDTIDIDADEL